MGGKMLIAFAVLSLVYTGASALQLECMSCMDMQQKNSFDDLPDFETDRYCGSPDIFHMPDTTLCDDDQSCAALRGTAVLRIPSVGNVKYQATWRGCAPLADTGCVTISGRQAAAILDLILHYDVVNFNGSMCICNSPVCMADTCGDGYLSIANYCFTWWFVLIVFLAAIPIVSCCFCCCCCCCCCRRKSTPGAVVVNRSNDRVILIHTEEAVAVDNRPPPYSK